MGNEEKADLARGLAEIHYQVEVGNTRIFRATGSADDGADREGPIKLLEVIENAVPAGIMPLHFGPVPEMGVPCSSVIIEVTPDEYRKLQKNELRLPQGWENLEELPRPPWQSDVDWKTLALDVLHAAGDHGGGWSGEPWGLSDDQYRSVIEAYEDRYPGFTQSD